MAGDVEKAFRLLKLWLCLKIAFLYKQFENFQMMEEKKLKISGDERIKLKGSY